MHITADYSSYKLPLRANPSMFCFLWWSISILQRLIFQSCYENTVAKIVYGEKYSTLKKLMLDTGTWATEKADMLVVKLIASGKKSKKDNHFKEMNLPDTSQ